MSRLAVVGGCFLAIQGLAAYPSAQTVAQAPPAFEVASVKPSSREVPRPSGRLVGGRFSVSSLTLRDLVLRAYELFDAQLVGGPDWQTSQRFDIEAKAQDSVARMADMLPMLKTLLADRFKLKVHTEKREMPVFALIVARDDGRLGPNITRSTADCSNAEQALAEIRAKTGAAAVLELLQKGQGLPCAIMPTPTRAAGMTMRANGVSMADLTRFLTPSTGRIVQDRTGLNGVYDWQLTYNDSPAGRFNVAPSSPGGQTPLSAPPSDSPSLMIALREQLGLELVSTRAPVEVLVIDSAALPEPD